MYAQCNARREDSPNQHQPQRPRRRQRTAVTLAIALLCCTLGVSAAPALDTNAPASVPDSLVETAEPSVTLPSADELKAKIKDTESATTPDEAAKAILIELYRRTLANVETTQTQLDQAAKYADALETSPAKTATIREELEQQELNPAASLVPEKLTPDQVTQQLDQAQTESALLETKLAELDKLIDGAINRPTEARARIIELKQSLDEIGSNLAQRAPGTQTPEQVQARDWALASDKQAKLAEIKAIERELASQVVRQEFYRANRDKTALDLEQLKARQAQLASIQAAQRKSEAEQAQIQTEEAKRDAADKHPLVQQIAAENADITENLGRLASAMDALAAETANVDQERRRMEQDFRGVRQRVEAAGLDRALGQILIERRAGLPDLRAYSKTVSLREDQIAEATLNQIRYREEQRRLQHMDDTLSEILAQDPQARAPEIRAEIMALLKQRQSLLEKILTAEDAYIRALGEFNDSASQMLDKAQSYEEFLAEHLLWVRSVHPMGIETITDVPSGIDWILSPKGWAEVLRTIVYELTHSPLTWLGWITVTILYWKTSALKRAILQTAEPLRRIRTDHFQYTIRALWLTLLVALPLPMLIWLLGRDLSASIEATSFTRSVGWALIDISLGLYFLRALRVICMPGGLADRHFRWSTVVLVTLRRNLLWFTAYMVPTAFVAFAVYYHNDPVNSAALGRIALIASMAGFSLFYLRIFNPKTGVLTGLLAEKPQGWSSRSLNLWYPALVVSPLVLATLTVLGYQYTAGTLFQALIQTDRLVVGLIVLQQMVVRWLIVIRRRIALQAALDRQAARRAQAMAEKSMQGSVDNPGLSAAEETEVDLESLDGQTRKLINAAIAFAAILGVWLIWSPMLPAFGMLEQFALWHYKGVLDGTEQMIPVSVADVALVLAIIVTALVAAKNLPALIEIVLLEATSVTAGSRYAIKTLASYVITATAFLTAFGTLGLSWSQIQWLVAALSVGIGFGLQEIVANFISGLIILFERPVRVGDVVTIGDTTGAVTNIQIRATTIRNWDKQELLVPNKEFITGRLLNWTLSDQINRIVIAVGIEYGSDTELALALLTQVARGNSRVLEDPAPVSAFEGFGDNALQVTLRCYLDSMEFRLSVISELHLAIDKAFATNGIIIAFPQRDIHLSTREPIDIRLQRGARP